MVTPLSRFGITNPNFPYASRHGRNRYATVSDENVTPTLFDEGMNPNDPKGKGKGTRSRATSVSRVVIDDVEGDEGIGGKRDEEAERNKAREEQFSKLAGQFRGKKEAINAIMNKVGSILCTVLGADLSNNSLILCLGR